MNRVVGTIFVMSQVAWQICVIVIPVAVACVFYKRCYTPTENCHACQEYKELQSFTTLLNLLLVQQQYVHLIREITLLAQTLV
ncbi:unnamed protein product [Brassica oleracea]